MAEFLVANFVLWPRAASGLELVPVEVHFAHARPEDVSQHEWLFQAPLRFGAEHNQIVLSEQLLATPHACADSALNQILERHAAELSARLKPTDSLPDRVRELLASELRAGNPSADRIAHKLHMSVRTLARRLGEAGTSHKQLLDEVRAHLAQRYLCEEQLAVAEVAFLLGFSEPSAFHRAFRRWFGMSPAALRERGTA